MNHHQFLRLDFIANSNIRQLLLQSEIKDFLMIPEYHLDSLAQYIKNFIIMSNETKDLFCRRYTHWAVIDDLLAAQIQEIIAIFLLLTRNTVSDKLLALFLANGWTIFLSIIGPIIESGIAYHCIDSTNPDATQASEAKLLAASIASISMIVATQKIMPALPKYRHLPAQEEVVSIINKFKLFGEVKTRFSQSAPQREGDNSAEQYKNLLIILEYSYLKFLNLRRRVLQTLLENYQKKASSSELVINTRVGLCKILYGFSEYVYPWIPNISGLANRYWFYSLPAFIGEPNALSHPDVKRDEIVYKKEFFYGLLEASSFVQHDASKLDKVSLVTFFEVRQAFAAFSACGYNAIINNIIVIDANGKEFLQSILLTVISKALQFELKKFWNGSSGHIYITIAGEKIVLDETKNIVVKDNRLTINGMAVQLYQIESSNIEFEYKGEVTSAKDMIEGFNSLAAIIAAYNRHPVAQRPLTPPPLGAGMLPQSTMLLPLTEPVARLTRIKKSKATFPASAESESASVSADTEHLLTDNRWYKLVEKYTDFSMHHLRINSGHYLFLIANIEAANVIMNANRRELSLITEENIKDFFIDYAESMSQIQARAYNSLTELQRGMLTELFIEHRELIAERIGEILTDPTLDGPRKLLLAKYLASFIPCLPSTDILLEASLYKIAANLFSQYNFELYIVGSRVFFDAVDSDVDLFIFCRRIDEDIILKLFSSNSFEYKVLLKNDLGLLVTYKLLWNNREIDLTMSFFGTSDVYELWRNLQKSMNERIINLYSALRNVRTNTVFIPYSGLKNYCRNVLEFLRPYELQAAANFDSFMGVINASILDPYAQTRVAPFVIRKLIKYQLEPPSEVKSQLGIQLQRYQDFLFDPELIQLPLSLVWFQLDRCVNWQHAINIFIWVLPIINKIIFKVEKIDIAISGKFLDEFLPKLRQLETNYKAAILLILYSFSMLKFLDNESKPFKHQKFGWMPRRQHRSEFFRSPAISEEELTLAWEKCLHGQKTGEDKPFDEQDLFIVKPLCDNIQATLAKQA